MCCILLYIYVCVHRIQPLCVSSYTELRALMMLFEYVWGSYNLNYSTISMGFFFPVTPECRVAHMYSINLSTLMM